MPDMPSPKKVIDHPDGTRVCTVCEERQPINNFDIDKNASAGRRSHCKACRSERMRKWYEDNQERQLARHHERIARDPDRIREQDSQRYRRHREKRIELATEAVHIRRQRVQQFPQDRGITTASLRELYGDNCMYCGVEMIFVVSKGRKYIRNKATIEHVLPISQGGAHDWDNCRLCCWRCNLRKNKKRAHEFDPDATLGKP
jgi:5-methylcytosine-specific restriction endonuclease McrA